MRRHAKLTSNATLVLTHSIYNRRMRFGVVSYTADYTTGPVQRGKEIMDRGLEALFVPEHSHIPVRRETPWGGLQHADQASTDDPMWMPDWYEFYGDVELPAVLGTTERDIPPGSRRGGLGCSVGCGVPGQ